MSARILEFPRPSPTGVPDSGSTADSGTLLAFETAGDEPSHLLRLPHDPGDRHCTPGERWLAQQNIPVERGVFIGRHLSCDGEMIAYAVDRRGREIDRIPIDDPTDDGAIQVVLEFLWGRLDAVDPEQPGPRLHRC